MNGSVVVLSGGVGGAKLVLGLSKIITDENLVVACNTADDFEYLGLRVCPDMDSVLYALAGLSDEGRGWGRGSETWTFMSAVKELGGPVWFNLGDKDLATHVLRTQLLRGGASLSDVTMHLAEQMGVSALILPMSDECVTTTVHTANENLEFQKYFVELQCAPIVNGFSFANIENARPQKQVESALRDSPCAVVIAPSNPYVSVDPILKVPGMREAISASDAPVVAVSPIIGGQAVKGPAAKMMAELGVPVSVLGIALHYQGFLDGMIVDEQDRASVGPIEDLGIKTHVTHTIMTDLNSKKMLARETLQFAEGLSR